MADGVVKTEYERLKEQGYTEEEISVQLDNLSRYEISDNPKGDKRQDRTVNAFDSAGVSRRICPIIMGHNKQGIILENGEYLSWEEVEQVLQNYLSGEEEEVTYVSRNDGKVVEPAEIIEDIMERSIGKTYLTQSPVENIANQQAVQMIIHDEKKGAFPKGVSFLGKEGMQLPSGAYVSRVEIEAALREYAIMKGPKPIISPPLIEEEQEIPKPPTIEEETIEKEEPQKEEPTKENKTYRVIKRIFYKSSLAPLIMAVAMQILSGFGMEDVMSKQEFIRKANNLGYNVSKVKMLEDDFETSFDVAERLYGEMDVGKKVPVDEGVPYYSSSDHAYGGSNRQGVFGQGIREEGNYTVDGFSILKEGKIHEVEWNQNENLYDTLEKISKETNTPIEDLIPMVHIGGPVAGWVDVRDLFSDKEKEAQVIGQTVILDEKNTYEGIVEDFSGDTITIDVDGKDVKLKVRNDDGSLVSDGDIVIGDDGQKYQMTNLELEETEIIDVVEEKVGTKLNWSIKNMSLEETLAIAGAAAAMTYLSSKIKRKEMVDVTDDYIERLADDALKRYEESKGEYEGQSAFKKATETLTGKQVVPPHTAQEILAQELINQNITIENITDMGENTTGGIKK